jgi:hypothetical protein
MCKLTNQTIIIALIIIVAFILVFRNELKIFTGFENVDSSCPTKAQISFVSYPFKIGG